MTDYPTPDPEQPELISEPRADYHLSLEAQAEKDAYLKRLELYLHDPEFRTTAGFPLGTDKAILALSDPPYYTACPNPFLREIVSQWQDEREILRKNLKLPNNTKKERSSDSYSLMTYHREPFASDVSEGKSGGIYGAHSYHTKVPHRAIMRYILHYTEPGDILLDGFGGTGMTGVAAQLCGDKQAIEGLGYSVKKDGRIVDEMGKVISHIGSRKAVINDLSPAATFISYNYNTPISSRSFEWEARRILQDIENKFTWLYQTKHNNGWGRVNYTVWGTVFLCPSCFSEVVLSDLENKDDVGNLKCPNCKAILKRDQLEYLVETVFDEIAGTSKKVNKKVPILINYTYAGHRYNKNPDEHDLEIISKSSDLKKLPWFPNELFLFLGKKWGDTYRAGYHFGYERVNDFYFGRVLYVLSHFYEMSQKLPGLLRFRMLSLLTSVAFSSTHLYKYRTKGGGQPAGNNLYIPALIKEQNILDALERKLKAFLKAEEEKKALRAWPLITTQSTSELSQIQDKTFDYIFIDPPFGANIMYSESNFIWESWLQVFTNQSPEAIINKTQSKDLNKYQSLMQKCFDEFYRLLKPGRWLTVEFHNSQNSIWNAIQESLLQAGFVVADVRTLDKKQGTFKQVTSSGAVKQDLVISSYKPNAEFEKKFLEQGGTVQGVWEFVRQHLDELPLPKVDDGILETLSERMPYLLYDRMVAFHIVRGLNIPLSAAEFYQGLSQRFLERDSMIFTAAQAASYDKLRLQAERVEQLTLFVTDENSARQWLRQELEPSTGRGSQTYSELQPRFVQLLHQSKYEDLPELLIILEQNFLRDDSGCWYIPDPENAADLEKLRENVLLRDFNDYLKTKGKLKVFRSEAIQAGFSKCWRERQYEIIVQVAERLPEAVLQEDPKLKIYYDNAFSRASKQPKQERLI